MFSTIEKWKAKLNCISIAGFWKKKILLISQFYQTDLLILFKKEFLTNELNLKWKVNLL